MTEAPRYFLTAYGLALKHGFQGSEKEWLESLTAFGLAVAQGYSGSFNDWIQKLNDPVPALTVGSTQTIAAGLDARVFITGDKKNPVLHFEIPRGEGSVDALMRSGGVMMGVLDMDGNALRNIPAPEADLDAANKKYVDDLRFSTDQEIQNVSHQIEGISKEMADIGETAGAALPMTGGTMTGALIVIDPTENGHAANKGYVDSRHFFREVALSVSGWTGTAAPYTQQVAVADILETDRPHFGPVYSKDNATMIAEMEAWSFIVDLETSDGYVVFTCPEEKPATALTIQLEVHR